MFGIADYGAFVAAIILFLPLAAWGWHLALRSVPERRRARLLIWPLAVLLLAAVYECCMSGCLQMSTVTSSETWIHGLQIHRLRTRMYLYEDGHLLSIRGIQVRLSQSNLHG